MEDVIESLASQCDGARSRDGRGFNRADAQEGGRLAALKKNGMAWSKEDAIKALELGGRYAKQAGDLLSDGSKKKSDGIEGALRNNFVKCHDEIIEKQEPYNYCGMSPGGKKVYLWKMAWIEDIKEFKNDIYKSIEIKHGVRRIQVEFDQTSEMTMNGIKQKFKRSSIDFNGSTQEHIIKLCKKHNFIIEPAIERHIDLEIDEIRKNERAAWIHDGYREGAKGKWIICDLNTKCIDFSEAVKKYCFYENKKRFYTCDPKDDWNWYLECNEKTLNMISQILIHFKFSLTSDLKKVLLTE